MARQKCVKKTHMKVVDLTHLIHEHMTVYTGSEKPVLKQMFKIDKDGFVEIRMTLYSHTGTHVDAPAHMIEEGKTLDRFTPDKFIGTGMIIDFPFKNGTEIAIDILKEREEQIISSDFVILRTGWDKKWGTDDYFGKFPVLTREAVEWLALTGIKGVGVDSFSVDPIGDENMNNHHVLLGREIIIIENLTGLDDIPDKGFIFQCMPMLIDKADGSPVRALAIIS